MIGLPLKKSRSGVTAQIVATAREIDEKCLSALANQYCGLALDGGRTIELGTVAVGVKYGAKVQLLQLNPESSKSKEAMLKVIETAKTCVEEHRGKLTSLVTDAASGLVGACIAWRSKGVMTFICTLHAIQLVVEKILRLPIFVEAMKASEKSQAHRPRNATRWWSALSTLVRTRKVEQQRLLMNDGSQGYGLEDHTAVKLAISHLTPLRVIGRTIESDHRQCVCEGHRPRSVHRMRRPFYAVVQR
jgi:hypothetical protein